MHFPFDCLDVRKYAIFKSYFLVKHPGKKQIFCFDLNKVFYVTKILKYHLVVQPNMKYRWSNQFQIPGTIL